MCFKLFYNRADRYGLKYPKNPKGVGILVPFNITMFVQYIFPTQSLCNVDIHVCVTDTVVKYER